MSGARGVPRAAKPPRHTSGSGRWLTRRYVCRAGSAGRGTASARPTRRSTLAPDSPRDAVSGRLNYYVTDGADELRFWHGAEELLLHLAAVDHEEVGDG